MNKLLVMVLMLAMTAPTGCFATSMRSGAGLPASGLFIKKKNSLSADTKNDQPNQKNQKVAKEVRQDKKSSAKQEKLADKQEKKAAKEKKKEESAKRLKRFGADEHLSTIIQKRNIP